MTQLPQPPKLRRRKGSVSSGSSVTTRSLSAVPPTVADSDARPARRPANGKAGERGELLKLSDVLAELGITRSTFYDWRAKRKAPPCIKLPNGDLRIRRVELDRWLTSLEDEAA